MSQKSSLNDGKTLKQKLEAARAGEFSQGVRPSHSKSLLTLSMIVLLLVIAVTAIAIAVAFPWLLQQPREMLVPLLGIAATLIVAASLTLSVLSDRQTDEWNRSAARFSSQWGYMAGLVLAAPLIFLLSNWIGSLAPDGYQAFVRIGFGFGFLAVLIAQVVCVALLRVGWIFWMSRSARRPHEKQD